MNGTSESEYAQKAADEAENVARRVEELTASAPIARSKPVKPGNPAQPGGSAAFNKAMGGIPTSLPADKGPTTTSAGMVEIANFLDSKALERSIGTIAVANKRSSEEGKKALFSELRSNPDLVEKFGARASQNGRPKSLGHLDLDGDGIATGFEIEVIATTIGEMQNTHSNTKILDSLGTASFREHATTIMNAMLESMHHRTPIDVAENTCPKVPLRIIPCPKDSNSR